jgi:acyl-coenzyme A thioesterase PaaI-like protein
MLEILRANPPEALKTLNGELLDIDSTRGYARFRFEVVPAFCHSQGRVCQGGFLTGMVDTAMANAAIVKGKLAVAVPTLELKISFFEAMGPGDRLCRGPRDALGRLGRLPRRRPQGREGPPDRPLDLDDPDRAPEGEGSS